MKKFVFLKPEEVTELKGGDPRDAAYLIGAGSALTTLIVLAPVASTYLLIKSLFK